MAQKKISKASVSAEVVRPSSRGLRSKEPFNLLVAYPVFYQRYDRYVAYHAHISH